MQIRCKLLKVKYIYEKGLKEVTCDLLLVLNKNVKSIKKLLQELKSVWKFMLHFNILTCPVKLLLGHV